MRTSSNSRHLSHHQHQQLTQPKLQSNSSHLLLATLLSTPTPSTQLPTSTITMAAFTLTNCPMVAYGRSGYNKDGDDEEDKYRNFGRSGYNKDGDDEEDKYRNFGRSGYNKDGKDDEDDN